MHRFILTDLNGVEFMSTEVDAFDPSIDAEFWETFMGGACAMVYLGEFKEEGLIMNTIEKLKKASELLESAYYDLNISLNVEMSIQRGVSVAQDLTEDAINYLENKQNA